MGFDGKVDVSLVKAGFGGLYDPQSLLVLEFTQLKLIVDEKTIYPLVVGDTIKCVFTLEELREIFMMDCGLKLYWHGDKMKKVTCFKL